MPALRGPRRETPRSISMRKRDETNLPADKYATTTRTMSSNISKVHEAMQNSLSATTSIENSSRNPRTSEQQAQPPENATMSSPKEPENCMYSHSTQLMLLTLDSRRATPFRPPGGSSQLHTSTSRALTRSCTQLPANGCTLAEGRNTRRRHDVCMV